MRAVDAEYPDVADGDAAPVLDAVDALAVFDVGLHGVAVYGDGEARVLRDVARHGDGGIVDALAGRGEARGRHRRIPGDIADGLVVFIALGLGHDAGVLLRERQLDHAPSVLVELAQSAEQLLLGWARSVAGHVSQRIEGHAEIFREPLERRKTHAVAALFEPAVYRRIRDAAPARELGTGDPAFAQQPVEDFRKHVPASFGSYRLYQ